jgi:hypothetical protein
VSIWVVISILLLSSWKSCIPTHFYRIKLSLHARTQIEKHAFFFLNYIKNSIYFNRILVNLRCNQFFLSVIKKNLNRIDGDGQKSP